LLYLQLRYKRFRNFDILLLYTSFLLLVSNVITMEESESESENILNVTSDIETEAASTSGSFRDDNFCVVCDKEMKPAKIRTLGKVAVENLIDASLQRKDKKHQRMRRMDSITVHNSCYIYYTNKSKIAIAVKKVNAAQTQKRIDFVKARNFNYKNLCIFCEKSTDILVCKKQVCFIKSEETVQKLIDEINNRSKSPNNELLRQRLQIFQGNANFEAIGARYHKLCFASFYMFGLALMLVDLYPKICPV